MITVDNSSIVNTSLNRTVLANNNCPSNRKRCISLIGKQNHVVGKRLKIVPVYTAMLPQKRVQVRKNLPVDSKVLTEGTNIYTDVITSKTNNDAKNRNDEGEDVSSKPTKPNCDSAELESVSWINSARNITPKTRKSTSCVMGPSADVSKTCKTKVNFIGKNYSSNVANNTAQIFSETENCPSGLNASVIDGNLHTDVNCVGDQKVHPIAKKEHSGDTMLSRISTGSHIRDDDCHKLDNRNGRDVASEEGNIADSAVSIELVKSPLKNEKEKTTMRGEKVSGSDVAFEVAESTSYQKVSHNELNSTGSENQNKTSSVVNVKTISTKDLMKFLRRYNLTLKAVPTNNKNVPNTVNIKSAKFRTVTVNTNSCCQSIPKSCKESISPGPIESKRTVNIKSESVSGNVSSSKTLLSNIKPQYNGNTVFRTTPQGTFSDWKIDVARSAKLCRRPPRISLNSDGRRLNTKNAKLSYSACPKTTVKSHRKLCKRTKNAYHAQAVAVKSHNRSEFLYLSDFECPMKLFPLSTAFRDLEARDKAFRETIETSRSCTGIDLTVNSTACRGNCPLSPTMNTLVNKRNCLRNVVEFHDSDPVLASVVGFDNSETDVDDMEDNLSLNRVLLPAVANNRLKNRRRILDITHGKHNSELQKFKYEPSSGCGEIQKSRSTVKPQLEKDVIHDSDSSIFYGFPDSDVDDSSYAVPVIDLKSVPTPVSQHHTEKENYEAMKNSCKNSLDSVSKIRTKGNRAIKIDNHDLNTSNDASYQLHSSNADIRCSKIKNYNSISTSSSHCSAETCVTPNDAMASSSLESAQTKTGSDIKMKAVNSLFDNHLTKPVEEWTSDEVSSWLTNTIQKYQSESQTSCQGASSKNIKIDESKNLSGNIFSKIKTGRTLRDLDLDKLTAFCEGDSLLVEYLHKKVNQLVESSEKNKIDSATKYKAESDMHQQYRGQCVVANSSYVSAPSVEQLEELVNYEDLLGSDSILGSLELTDVLESHGSFLKSLGQENENRFHQQFNGYNSSQFSQIYNHFSPAGGIPSYDTGHLHGNKFHQYPDVYHNAPSELQSGDFAHHNVSLLNEFSSMSERNTEEINFSNTHFNGPLSPPSVSTATEYCPPISPSTFYNVPPPPLIAMHDCVSEVPGGGAHEINAVTSHAGEMLSPNFICSRDSTMSDTDSGIHSPDSTPNKYTLVGNVPAITDFTCDKGVDPNLQTPSINGLNNFSLPIRSSNWQGHARNVLLNSQSIGTLEYNHNKIFTMTGDGSVRQEKSVDSNEESWERSSTSSTTSTLTAGESETKLLNMDDCKMYLTNSSSQSRQSFDCSLNGNSSMLTVHTADGNVVFIPSSQNMTTTPSPTQSIVHSHTSKNSHQFVTQGNITTVYPSFLPQSRRTSCSSQTGGSAGIFNKTQGHDRELIDTSVNSKITMNQNSNSICGVQNRLIGSFDSNNNKRRFQDNMVRRHTCDGPDGSFMDSFDLKIRRTTGKSIHLWEFIRDTLLNHSYCPRLIKWEDRKSGIFRFVQSDVVAGMWGEKKNNPKMTYEKLSRAMRYYYNRGILERVDGRRLVYKFGPNAHGWQQAAGCDETEEPCHETQEESKIKIENVPENNSLQSQKPNSLSSLRRPATCKISVAMSDKIIPSPKKRRRLSNDAPQQNPCTIDAAEKAKSMEKQTPAGLNNQIVKVKEECEKLIEVNPEPFKSASTPPAEHTSCIVYVARQVKQPAQDEKQNEDELPSVTSSKASTWLTNRPDNNTSPSKSSKLPSAEVLLGKQYKIATVQCK